MKKLLLLAVAFAFSSLAVMATPDTLISKVYYNLIDSSLTAIVTHDGNVEDGAGYKDNVAIPATITIGEDTYTVVGIADSTFANCGAVKKVTIGSNVVSLGKDIFVGCDKLATIVWKATRCGDFEESPFLGLTALKDVEFDKVKYIPANLLRDLELESVVLETTKTPSVSQTTTDFPVNAERFSATTSAKAIFVCIGEYFLKISCSLSVKISIGSPSLILNVFLISLGITTLPSSSTLLTIPVSRIKKSSATIMRRNFLIIRF
jgi:hypothetical protein